MRHLGSSKIISLTAVLFVLLLFFSLPEHLIASSSPATESNEALTNVLQEETSESEPLLARILNIDSESPPDLVVFLGRFHPLVVHLPISFILLALLIEVTSRFKRFADLKPASSFVLLLGFLSSVVAVFAGLLLSLGGDYGGSTLFWHQWLGIGVMVTAGLAYFYKRKSLGVTEKQPRLIYSSILTTSCIILVFASHYGGSLTHGSDYLTSYMPEPARSWLGIPPRDTGSDQILLTNIEEAHVFDNVVSPILESKCTTCHNDNKQKGDLILTSQAAILSGGENGSIIEAGNATTSELTRRLRLAPDHDDHMPPDGRKPLSEDYIRILEWWVNEGAPFESSVGEMNITEDIQSVFDRMSQEAEEAALAMAVPPPNPEALSAVSNLGVLIQPLSQETNLLQAQFLNVVDSFSDEDLDLLLPLSEQLTWLDLGRTGVTDKGLEVIGGLKNLRKLHLEKTAISDDGLVHLGDLEQLEYLNLYGTSITDAGLSHLQTLSNLRSLYLWQTNVTQEGATELQQALPDLYINMGWENASFSD